MKKLIVYCIAALWLILPSYGFSQTLSPKIRQEAGKSLFCFDSLQANKIAQQLSLLSLYKNKIEALEAIEKSLEAEIDAREKAFLSQHYELLRTTESLQRRATQIELLEKNILASQNVQRKQKRTIFAYKILSTALTGIILYKIIVKP